MQDIEKILKKLEEQQSIIFKAQHNLQKKIYVLSKEMENLKEAMDILADE